MRIINPIYKQTYRAAEDLAAHRLVIESAVDGECEYPAADADTQHLGVTLSSASAGQQVDICMLGPCLVTVDGNAVNIAKGDWLISHGALGYATGQALVDGATLHELIGWALEPSTADNDEIAIFFQKVPAFLT